MSENQPLPVSSLPQSPARLSPSEERMWAMLAHLTVLINLVTGGFGPVAALIIFLVYKDRSRYVAYQSLQSLILQLIGWVGGGVIVAAAWAISGILSAFFIGCCMMPFALLLTLFLPVGTIVYAIIAATKTNQGEDFRYWLIGDWVRSTYTG